MVAHGSLATTSGTTVINNAISSTSNRLNSVTPTIAGTPGTTVNWTYDAAGNAATLSPGFTLFYDATGRLVRSGSGITATSFTVDTAGLRRSKITPSGTYAGEVYYAYDQARRLIGIYNASGAPIQEFIYLGSSWQVLAVVQAGVVYPVRADQLGSPNHVLDPTTGTARCSTKPPQLRALSISSLPGPEFYPMPSLPLFLDFDLLGRRPGIGIGRNAFRVLAGPL